MPRRPRLHVPGAMYHVTARGNHRQDLFYQRADRLLLDDIMANALARTGARIHGYCWMTTICIFSFRSPRNHWAD